MTNQVRVNGANIHFVDVGSGPVLLLVHGFPLDHTMWQEQINFFQKTHRVIAPDLRGFGKSSGTQDITRMDEFADDLSSLLNELQISETVTLCGLSMGGYIAFQFALHYPQQLNGLILCDTKATADSEEAKQNRYDTAERVLDEGSDFLAQAMPEKLFSTRTFESNPFVIDAIKSVIQNTSSPAIASASKGMAERPDVTKDLLSINVPTLVIVGEDDAITTVQDMQLIADSIPSATLKIIPNAGHMSPLENPETVNKAIQAFLNCS